MQKLKNYLEKEKLITLLDEFRSKIQELPGKNRLPTFVSNYLCGFTEINISNLIHESKFGIVKNNQLFIGSEFLPSENLNNFIYKLAIYLHNKNIIKKISTELFDITSNRGIIFCKAPRELSRILGLKTKVIHLNAITENNKIYISRRSNKKEIDPNKLNTLASGLVSHNENINLTLEREANEECGISKNIIYNSRGKIKKIFHIYRNIDNGFQNEEIFVSQCTLKDNIKFKNNDGEVSEFLLIDNHKILNFIEEGRFTLESSLVILNYLISVTN